MVAGFTYLSFLVWLIKNILEKKILVYKDLINVSTGDHQEMSKDIPPMMACKLNEILYFEYDYRDEYTL